MAKKEKNKTKKRKGLGKNPKYIEAEVKKKKADDKKTENEKDSTAKDEKTEKIKEGSEQESAYLAKWTAPEFIKTREEALFYYASAVLSFFMIIWSLLQQSFVTVATFALLIVVIVFHIKHEPRNIEYKIDLDGITKDGKLYKYNDIESFEIVQGENANILKFKLKNSILPSKEICLADQNSYYIHAALEYFLPEEKQKEALVNFEKKEEISEEELREYMEEIKKAESVEKRGR